MFKRLSAKSFRGPAPAFDLTRSVATAALVLSSLTLAACSSTPKPERLPPQTMSASPPPEPDNSLGPDPREPVAETEPETVATPESTDRRSALTVVIEEEDAEQSKRRSLVEAAAAERKRRETAGESIAVITNENLSDFSEGQLTEMGEPEAPPDAAKPDAGGRTDSPSSMAMDETADAEAYWRGRVLKARKDWASAVEEISHLESRIAELRQRFYAEEDPYYRDSQIKPSWDHALDRLEEAKAAAEKHRIEVHDVLEEGRRASALPGWLREGIDLEPEVVESDRDPGMPPPGEYVPEEPKVATDPDGRRR
ncbi:MAG: hypothetical protein GY769_22625 [bacterium]|nr:hypothetical protein [bacterium]